jgi:hypothetical protein
MRWIIKSSLSYTIVARVAAQERFLKAHETLRLCGCMMCHKRSILGREDGPGLVVRYLKQKHRLRTDEPGDLVVYSCQKIARLFENTVSWSLGAGKKGIQDVTNARSLARKRTSE